MELVQNPHSNPLRDQFKLLFFANPDVPLKDLAERMGIKYHRAYKWFQRNGWEAELARIRSATKPLGVNSKTDVVTDSSNNGNFVAQSGNLQSKTEEKWIAPGDKRALSPEKMAELMAQRSISTKERLSRAVHRAAEHAADVMTEDELIDKADKLNNLAKTASTVHAWDGVGAGGHGGININILTDEVKIVQLTQDGKQSGS